MISSAIYIVLGKPRRSTVYDDLADQFGDFILCLVNPVLYDDLAAILYNVHVLYDDLAEQLR